LNKRIEDSINDENYRVLFPRVKAIDDSLRKEINENANLRA
jgi:hypothetical protein